MRIIFLVFVFFILGCEPQASIKETVENDSSEMAVFNIRILNEFSQPLTSGSVYIGDQVFKSGPNGGVEAMVGQDRLYRLRFSAPGYYSMVHTFSDRERIRLDGHLPPVVLVEKKQGRAMLAFGGDVVVGRRYHKPNPGERRWVGENSRLEDTKTLLTPIKPYLDLADYVSVNLESPVLEAEPEEKSDKFVTFFSYPETLEALEWAGVDYVSLGNNHTYDYHEPGMDETLVRLESSNLGYSGSGRNEREALAAYRTAIAEKQYRFLGFVGWPGRVTPNQVAEENKGGAALGTLENIVKAVSAQDKESVTVAQYHGSREYSFQPTDETRERLYKAIDTGADLIIGHHPHVLHGFELYKDKLMAYSLGNFMFDQYIYETQRSALLYVWMDGDQFYRAEIVPLYINGYRPTPAVGGIRDYVLRRLDHQSSLEGLQLGTSGGHAVIEQGRSQEHSASTGFYSHEGVSKPLSWFEQLDGLSFNESGVHYRVGTDAWSLGDFEHQHLFGIPNQDWQFSHADSSIEKIGDEKGYGMNLARSSLSETTSAGQKYFTRAWNSQPKSVVLSVNSAVPVEVQFCLELRARHMSTAEARANPVEECQDARKTESNRWQQLVFDFDAPSKDKYRGMRFRLDFTSASETQDKEEADTNVLVDDLMFVSWGLEAVSEKDTEVELTVGKEGTAQYNVVDFRRSVDANTSGGFKENCCELIKKSTAIR